MTTLTCVFLIHVNAVAHIWCLDSVWIIVDLSSKHIIVTKAHDRGTGRNHYISLGAKWPQISSVLANLKECAMCESGLLAMAAIMMVASVQAVPLGSYHHGDMTDNLIGLFWSPLQPCHPRCFRLVSWWCRLLTAVSLLLVHVFW